MFNRDMKIGQNEKYDTTQTSTEGITAEELATINKKKSKLIDIYKKFDTNNDGKLDQIELAMAMDGFTKAAGDDNKLSGKELDELAKNFNETYNLSGDSAVKGKDLKGFLKSVRNFTKDDAKASTAGIILDDMLATDAKKEGYVAVDGQVGIYQKDGKYFQQSRGDGMINYDRVRESENGFVVMSEEEISAEAEAEKLAGIIERAQKEGFTPADNGVYTKDNQNYIYNVAINAFARAKLGEDGNYVPMTEQDLADEQAAIQAEQRRQELATPTDYTVQNGESFRALIKQSLEAQGIEVTDESMNQAINEFKENNPGKLHGRKGREYLYAGDVVKIAGGLQNLDNADEVKAAYRASLAPVEKPSPTPAVEPAPTGPVSPDGKPLTETKASGIYEADGKFYKIGSDGQVQQTNITRVNDDGTYYDSPNWDIQGRVIAEQEHTADGKTNYIGYKYANDFDGNDLTLKSITINGVKRNCVALYGQEPEKGPDVKMPVEEPASKKPETKNEKTEVTVAGMKFVNGKSENGYVLNNDGSISLETGHPDYPNITYSFHSNGKIKQIKLQKNGGETKLNYNEKGNFTSSTSYSPDQLRKLGLDVNNPSIISKYVPEWAQAPSGGRKPIDSNPNIVKISGADENGIYNNKQYTPVKGRGLCKYNPEYGAYELYTGTYNGKHYKNGEILNIATKTLVKYDEETSPSGMQYSDDYYRNYNTYDYASGSLTPLHRDPTYDSNVQIKIKTSSDERTYELAKGSSNGQAHWDFKDFVNDFVDSDTGAICAKKYATNTYYLVRDGEKLPVTIDKETRALMVEIDGKKYDMNDFMTGKIKMS